LPLSRRARVAPKRPGILTGGRGRGFGEGGVDNLSTPSVLVCPVLGLGVQLLVGLLAPPGELGALGRGKLRAAQVLVAFGNDPLRPVHIDYHNQNFGVPESSAGRQAVRPGNQFEAVLRLAVERDRAAVDRDRVQESHFGDAPLEHLDLVVAERPDAAPLLDQIDVDELDAVGRPQLFGGVG
jgi:hypothetical protein